MPNLLPIELSSTSFGQTVRPASMEVLSNFYLLKAVVRCASHHGWYFAVFESSLMPSVDDNIHQGSDSCTLMPEHSFSKLEDKECQASNDFKKEVHIPRKRQRLEMSTNRLVDGEINVVNAYMKN